MESRVSRADLKVYALAAQYCYFDVNVDFTTWQRTGGDNKEFRHFEPLFKRLHNEPTKYPFSDKDLGYFVGVVETKNETIVVLPGTRKTFQGLQDLDADFDLTSSDNNVLGFPCKIHRGFLDRYAQLREELLDFFRKRSRDRQKPVKLVGHSMGGVLAIMLSVELHRRKIHTQNAVVSFGTPKFGCDNLRSMIQKLNINITRISNLNDPMVHMVPYEEFRYVGSQIVVADYDETWVRLYILSTPLLLYTLTISFCGFAVLLLIISLHGCALTHSMVHYAKALDVDQQKEHRKLSITASRACINIPIFYVFLLSYVFTAKKLLNRFHLRF